MSILRVSRKIKPDSRYDVFGCISSMVFSGEYGFGALKFPISSPAVNFGPKTPYLSVVRDEPLKRGHRGATFQRLDDPATMRIGQTAYVPVYANKLWNDSGVDVLSGQIFNFAVRAGEKWIHWHKTCGADGYASTSLAGPLKIFRRVPKARWLQLIATIGRSIRSPVVIGGQLLNFFPSSRGRLYLFANDIPWMYWNNRGMIAVRITRTK